MLSEIRQTEKDILLYVECKNIKKANEQTNQK